MRDGFHAFSHDAKKVIAGNWAGKVSIWDSESAKELAPLSAAPPAIKTRLGTIQQQIGAQQPLVADLTKKHADMAAKIPAVQSRGTEAQKQINALNAQRKMADTELQNARKAIAEATAARDKADAANKPKFEEQLKQANAALGATTGKIAMIDKQLAGANNALKARQAELTAAKDQANKAKAELDTASQQLATLQRQAQFWTAAEINTQRLTKAGELAKLSAELEFLKEDLAGADQIIAKAQEKLAAAEKAAAGAAAATTAKANALNEAKAKPAAIDNKLRLTAVIVENKRIAVENLKRMEPKTEELKPVLAVATKEHEDAIARQKAEQAEKAAAQKAIAVATDELKKAQASQANAPKMVAAAKAELAAAHAKKGEVQKSLEAQQQKTAKAKQETDTLWASYQAALPK